VKCRAIAHYLRRVPRYDNIIMSSDMFQLMEPKLPNDPWTLIILFIYKPTASLSLVTRTESKILACSISCCPWTLETPDFPFSISSACFHAHPPYASFWEVVVSTAARVVEEFLDVEGSAITASAMTALTSFWAVVLLTGTHLTETFATVVPVMEIYVNAALLTVAPLGVSSRAPAIAEDHSHHHQHCFQSSLHHRRSRSSLHHHRSQSSLHYHRHYRLHYHHHYRLLYLQN
jgi:hypothetical protein